MRRLQKKPVPNILQNKKAAWTEELMLHVNNGETPPERVRYRYRHDEIKTTLKEETYEKCAYCESKMLHVSPGDIEHIVPYSARQDKSFCWENLTLACQTCNTQKGVYYDLNAPLINPYTEDPAHHLDFLGPQVTHKNGDLLGERTHKKLDLNRLILVMKRLERLCQIQVVIDRAEDLNSNADKQLIISELKTEAEPNAEYSAFVSNYLVSKGIA